MMGLNNSVHWLAWFITTFIQMSITMTLLTVMLKLGLRSTDRCLLLQVGPCGEVRAYVMALWGRPDLSPTCGDPHKEYH